MFQPTYCLVASRADRAQLEALVTNGRTPQKTAQRARSVLMRINHAKPSHVGHTLGLSRMRIRLWAQRYGRGITPEKGAVAYVEEERQVRQG